MTATTSSPAGVVLTTFERQDDAVRVVRALIERRLAACGNLVPGVRSIYRWRGRIEDAGEVLCVLKTAADRLPALIAALGELHPYEVPEIIALPIVTGSAAYLEWLAAETAPPPAP